MLKLSKNKRRLIKVVLIFILVVSNLAMGFPPDRFFKLLQDRKVVDVLYEAYKSGKVVDEALADGTTDVMMVYDVQDITSIPKYRVWNGSSWGSEASASNVSGEIRYMVVRYAPTRDEAIMVTLGSTGQVQAQVFNGTSWGSPTLLGTMNDANGDRDIQSQYRGFDLEYEQTSGDAIVVYGDGTADPDYKVWNGTSWSGATNIDIPNTGRPNFIELASRPGSDELAMI
ncbi:hypothetical protein MUP35_01615, partial [Patescibacteria group bacterium]|nr:hypothetical protein [Patescibacteria group bacterium]